MTYLGMRDGLSQYAQAIKGITCPILGVFLLGGLSEFGRGLGSRWVSG